MNTSSHSNWSSRIRLERLKRSWTQEHLAEQTKLSTRTIQRLESGEEPSLETIRVLAEAFGQDVQTFSAFRLRKQFTAPWDTKLKVITTTACALLLFLALFFQARWINKPYAPLFILPVILTMVYSIRGYSLRDGKLFIHRLGWSNSYDLSTLTRMEVNPHAMVGSMRMFGIGGMFSYSGFFRNTMLGAYRAYATNVANSMVLEFGGKRIVITPDSPEEMKLAIEDELKHLNG